MLTEEKYRPGYRRLLALFGTRENHLMWRILMIFQTRQPCDVTFYKAKPALDVTIEKITARPVSDPSATQAAKTMLDDICLSNGQRIPFHEIWTINPMPKGGIASKQLEAMDLATAEEKGGPSGETIRQMISDTYHCDSREEEDFYLRRFLAS